MANRPTMKKIQNGMNNMQNEIRNLRNTVEAHEERLRAAEEREIVEMLKETNMVGSNKPRYTYQEIANFIGVSPSTVSNVAAKNNLSRRNLTLV